MADTPYVPPKVWVWDKANGGAFASTNRPIAGATHDKDLPRGQHPFQLYSLATPNGVKVTVMLEELLALGHKGAEYDAWLIKIGEGEQFGGGFALEILKVHGRGSSVVGEAWKRVGESIRQSIGEPAGALRVRATRSGRQKEFCGSRWVRCRTLTGVVEKTTRERAGFKPPPRMKSTDDHAKETPCALATAAMSSSLRRLAMVCMVMVSPSLVRPPSSLRKSVSCLTTY